MIKHQAESKLIAVAPDCESQEKYSLIGYKIAKTRENMLKLPVFLFHQHPKYESWQYATSTQCHYAYILLGNQIDKTTLILLLILCFT